MRALSGGLIAICLMVAMMTAPKLWHNARIPPLPVAQMVEDVWAGDVPPYTGADFAPDPADFAAFTFDFQGHSRKWFGANLAAQTTPRGVIILLHGSNRNGASMMAMWQGVDSDFIIVAPDTLESWGWSDASDGSAFLLAVLDQVDQITPVDRSRVLLFGHSAGAQQALRIANTDSFDWAGVAVHGGIGDASSVRRPSHAVPVHFYLGDADHLLNLDAARQFGRAMAEVGHPVTLTTIPGQTHWFYDIGPAIAQSATDWFESL